MNQMFCFQCQEAANNTGCTILGVCGKTPQLSSLMDAFKYTLKGLGVVASQASEKGIDTKNVDCFIMESLFKTITNANFDDEVFIKEINEAITLRESLKAQIEGTTTSTQTVSLLEVKEMIALGNDHGVLETENEDIRSARETVIYGLIGASAYASHAYALGYESASYFEFQRRSLAALLDDSLGLMDYVAYIDECGKIGVEVMALLDTANTTTYGNPEISTVNLDVSNRPGILVSGHDLHDMKQLLEQSKDAGIDIYTHSEMLPTHYYPELKKYPHLVGNYGNAWWQQKEEFAKFNGPILFTTNCIVPPLKDANYKDRVYTTGNAGYPGFKHVPLNSDGTKDFKEIIELAKSCEAPISLETGTIVGGFAHNQVIQLADAVIENVKNGSIKKFVVMAGCDGRHSNRNYYTDFAKALPQDTIILTAGCAKYRYNKLNLGDINGIPRVLDAGQCNDSYSLVRIALALQAAFELDSVNDLPIAYNIAWYEQKAVIVLLALLHLGVKNIHIGPSLPAFLSPNVANFIIDTYQLGLASDVESDIQKLILA